MSRIGVDLGGTRIKAARVGTDFELERFETLPTPAGTPAEVLDAIATTVKTIDPHAATVGLAIPGEVDRDGRCWRLPNIAGFEGVMMARELERRVGGRVAVENDGTAAALGEQAAGHGRGLDSFLVVTLGTGVGGGLVVGGRAVRGRSGFAAEIGHVIVDRTATAPMCGCGQRGCLEAFAGTTAILEHSRALGGAPTSVRDVTDAARQGRRHGTEPMDRMTQALGDALISIQHLLDLDAIVFGGGVSLAFDLLEPGIRRALRARAFAKPLGEVPLLQSQLGDRAGVIGAALLVDDGV